VSVCLVPALHFECLDLEQFIFRLHLQNIIYFKFIYQGHHYHVFIKTCDKPHILQYLFKKLELRVLINVFVQGAHKKMTVDKMGSVSQ